MGKKLRCPVFVFIQGAYLCLHLCLFVHVMLTSAPAVPFSECDVCFTSVSHKSPHCQRCPPKRVRQTSQTSRWRRIVICKNAIYQTLPGRLGAFFHIRNVFDPVEQMSRILTTKIISICNLWSRSVPDLPTSLLLRKATPSLHRTLLHDITQVSPTLTYMGNLTFKNCSPVQRLI